MIRIQLASNFQVVELTYDNYASMNLDEVEKCIDLVNAFGARVNYSDKDKEKKTSVISPYSKFYREEPSEKQLELAKRLKIDVEGMSKEDLRIAIKNKFAQ